MAKMSNYLEEKLLNFVLRNVAYTAPTSVLVALYTTDPTDADSGTEVTGGSYARQTATFSAASNPAGTCTTSADISFPTATADWGIVTHIGIRDNTGTNLLFHTALDASKTINNGDQFKILAGNLTVTLA